MFSERRQLLLLIVVVHSDVCVPRLKRTSPTAYCDCWEKCKCRALIQGNQRARFDLLNRLLVETDLASRPNKRGEHTLLYLMRTVGRQMIEQKAHRAGRAKRSQQPPGAEDDMEKPEHDLEPPTFARRAIERMLADWKSVEGMINTGSTTVNK